MYGLQFEIFYYCGVVALASLAGASRCIYNGNYQSLGHCVSVAALSGILAFGVVVFYGGDIRNAGFDFWRNLGLSVFVGLLGREGLAVVLDGIPMVLKSIAKGRDE